MNCCNPFLKSFARVKCCSRDSVTRHIHKKCRRRSIRPSAGITATALDLPGHGEDEGALGDLHADAARVRETLDELGGAVVLVGHSYGGAVITEAGTHPAVQHLVYIAAFALDAGESCVSAATSEMEAAQISHEGRPNLGAAFMMEPGEAEIVAVGFGKP